MNKFVAPLEITPSPSTTVPSDHPVVTKERSSGTYHLSAYFMAKLVSELPLLFLHPTLFHFICHFIIGLNNTAYGFFGMWLTYIVTSLVGQSIGLFLSASFLNLKNIILYGSVLMLTFMLVGGFFAENLPFWLQWSKYTSFITYSYRACLQFSFPPDVQYR